MVCLLLIYGCTHKSGGGEEEEGEDDGNFLTLRQKSKDEQDADEKDFKKWLAGEGKVVPKARVAELEPLQRYWTDPNLSEEDRFLRDYITGELWRDRDREAVPTYKDVRPFKLFFLLNSVV